MIAKLLKLVYHIYVEKNVPEAGQSVLQVWIKPAIIIAVVFGIGFLLPVLTKNLVTKQSGIAPTTVPTESTIISGPSYKFSPGMLELAVNEKKTVAVLLKTEREKIEAFDFVLNYDKALVDVVSVKTSALFPAYPIVEYGNGVIKVSGTVGVADPVRLDETVFLIEFKGIAIGETDLNIDQDNSTIAAQGKNILTGSNTLMIKIMDKP
ncbi:hypothetical protein CO050_02390 [Candidatus Roizmanbacteria bacterium CG_4_9_14_0_2_um_filter_38_17]|nr:MAG: hypothetical protein CO050_02390 [Candidatus Roizmanbacteria bacterium CG_4_9_14_0_2_um_filter_38_17]